MGVLAPGCFVRVARTAVSALETPECPQKRNNCVSSAGERIYGDAGTVVK